MPKTSFEDTIVTETGIKFAVELTYAQMVYISRLIGRTRVVDGMSDEETLGLVSAHRKLKSAIDHIDTCGDNEVDHS